jgi:hypothetical protein
MEQSSPSPTWAAMGSRTPPDVMLLETRCPHLSLQQQRRGNEKGCRVIRRSLLEVGDPTPEKETPDDPSAAWLSCLADGRWLMADGYPPSAICHSLSAIRYHGPLALRPHLTMGLPFRDVVIEMIQAVSATSAKLWIRVSGLPTDPWPPLPGETTGVTRHPS